MDNPQKAIEKLLNKIRAQEQIIKESQSKNKMVGVMNAEKKINEYKAEIRRIQDTWM